MDRHLLLIKLMIDVFFVVELKRCILVHLVRMFMEFLNLYF